MVPPLSFCTNCLGAAGHGINDPIKVRPLAIAHRAAVGLLRKLGPASRVDRPTSNFGLTDDGLVPRVDVPTRVDWPADRPDDAGHVLVY